MFGLFMLLPLLSIYADGLHGASPILIGIALGVYGLTQVIFQIPFGIMADRYGRKCVITGGLVVFALGSVIAGLADSIFGLIIGRSLQGAGAISAVILALASDLIRVDQRTKAMAMIGLSIGASFMISLMAAPVLAKVVGVNGLFHGIAVLVAFAIVILYKWVPNPADDKFGNTIQTVSSKRIIEAFRNKKLWQPAIGILFLHMMLTSLFLVIPTAFVDLGGFPLDQHWKLYVPVLLISALGMAPLVKLASAHQHLRLTLRISISIVLISQILIFYTIQTDFWVLLVAVVMFFSAFNALEAILPSLASQQAPSCIRATTMSVYSMYQFSGVFLGGLSGGICLSRFGVNGVVQFSVVCCLIWLILTVILPAFSVNRTVTVDINAFDGMHKQQLIDRISRVDGVINVSIDDEVSIAYLEVDHDIYDQAKLQQLLKT